jgi:hypothetical protein
LIEACDADSSAECTEETSKEKLRTFAKFLGEDGYNRSAYQRSVSPGTEQAKKRKDGRGMYPSAPTTKSWYPESCATFFTGTSSCFASATVAGAIIGPGQAAKTMLLKNSTTKATSRFHAGQR